MKVLVTGSAGFIGSNLLLRLPGDVPVTYAGLTYLERDFGFRHSLEVLEERTVLFEAKNGKYEPLSEEDIMK